jgi:hypothetical protein
MAILSKQIKGLKLIKNIEACANKKIIIYTSNGFLARTSFELDDFQKHFCGWEIDEMKNLGFFYDMLIPKSFGETFHQFWLSLLIMWLIVSSIIQKNWCVKNLKNAAAILCVTNL